MNLGHPYVCSCTLRPAGRTALILTGRVARWVAVLGAVVFLSGIT